MYIKVYEKLYMRTGIWSSN